MILKYWQKQLKESADYLADHKEQGGCFRFNTVEIDDKGINKNVSIVLGWTDGFDVDFNQVYDKETGDVYDTEICLYPDTNFEKVADDIVTEFNYVLSSWKSWAHK